jgi:hypothetical protein
MKRLLGLDWDVFIPGHFWITDRAGFVASLDYYERMADAAQQAIVDGLDPYDMEVVRRYSVEKLDAQFGHLFRFDEYFAMNLWRYMQQFLTGGWGIEGNFRPNTTPF